MPKCHLGLYVLGSVALAYLLACVVYYVATRWMGTPFNDSLSESQKHIKQQSSKKRGMVFGAAFLVALLLVGGLAYCFYRP